LKHDANLHTGFIEGGNTVGVGLIVASMPRIYIAVAQQNLM